MKDLPLGGSTTCRRESLESYFNSHSAQWGYRSTNEDGTLVERWAESILLSLIHDAKQPKSFHRARWQQQWSYVLEVPDVDFIMPCGVVVFALFYYHLDLCCGECYVGCLQFECVPICLFCMFYV